MAAPEKSSKKRPAAKKKAPAGKKTTTRKPANRRPASKASARKQPAAYSRDAWQKTPAAAEDSSPEQPLMKTLRAEHRHIATVMQLFSDQLQAIENEQAVDPHIVYEVMEYMATWPDRFHHPREDLIYSRVAELDGKAADDVDTLQRDHDQMARRGQALLRDIERWREGELKGRTLVKGGREYVGHMYEHMNVEEKVVFPHIESVLSLEDWRELAEDDALKAVSLPVFGPRVQREFRNLARRMRRGVRRRVERGVVEEWVGIEALMESLEVLSLAYDTAKESAGDHLRTAFDDGREIVRETPVKAPLRLAFNNMKLGYSLVEDMIDITREVLEDLERVGREHQQRRAQFGKPGS